MNMLHYPETLREVRQFEVFDDFVWYISPHLWTALAADASSAVAIDADGVGGVVTISTAATDNNEAALFTTNELFLFAAGKPLIGEARIKFSDVNTDDGNVAFGFADAAGANLLGDDGAGDAINSSGALIFKVKNETTWRAAVEINGTVKETASTTTAGGSAYQTLRIVALPVDGTNLEVTYFCDGEPLRDSNGKAIKHTIAYASATEMDFGVYAKTGHATDLVVSVDYVFAAQLR